MTYLKKHIIILLCMLLSIIGIYQDYTHAKNTELSLSPLTPNQNTTIFAGYSADGSISDYVITYLKKLKEISPNIIFVTDNPISKSEIKKLTPYVNHLIAYRHEEYDWGSFKRGYNWLKQNSTPINNLIIANDSTISITNSFAPIFNDFKQKNTDFYGITANTDGTYHIQSFFMIFSPKVHTTNEFNNYLNSVTKQKDGLHVAYRYEVPFTQYLSSLGFSHSTYIAHNELSYLELNDKHCYPLSLLSKHNLPLLKMRTFTNRLIVKEPRRLVFSWLKKHSPQTHSELISHLKKINSPYLKENK